ncbi:MAG TPA: ATPase, partial [Anaeromyxobacter sp.]|nr:ATPase [Anaeromyxobacter sp.]
MPAPGAPPPAEPAAPQRPAFVGELDTLVRARYPLVYLVTSEEQRLEAILAGLADEHGKTLLGWSIARGFRWLGGAKGTAPEGAKDPIEALAAVERLSEPSLVVLKDFHPFLQDPTTVRALRELAHALKSTYTTVILLSPVLVIPPELEKELTVLDIPLPTASELIGLLREIVTVLREERRAEVDLTRENA